MSFSHPHFRAWVRTPAPWIAAGLGAWLAAGAPPARASVRVLESDARHAVLEITPEKPRQEVVPTADRDYVRLRIAGMGMTEETGRPEVPVGSAAVALPPGTVPRLRVVRQAWSAPRPGAITPVPERIGVRDPLGVNQVVEREPVEGAPYRAQTTYPTRPFRLSEIRDLRGLRVVHVIYHGVVAEVFSRTHRVLESAVLEVLFESDPGRARVPVTRPAPSDRLWERTRRALVINAEAAGAWTRGGPGDGSAVGDTPWGGGAQVKVRITETGLVELPYDNLAAVGFPSGVPVAQVSVYQRKFDLAAVDDPAVPAESLFVRLPAPSRLRDRNGNGTFDSGDGVLFYARSFRDQWMTSGWEHEDKFGTDNFYWVRADPAGGARMADLRPGGSLSGAPADSLDSTPSTVFREEDLKYYDHPADFGPGAGGFESEFYFWNNGQTLTGEQLGWQLPDNFEVPDPLPGRDATVVVRVCPGGRPGNSGYTNVVRFLVNGTQVGERQFYNEALYSGSTVPPSVVLNTHTIPAGVLTGGTNEFLLHGWTYTGFGTGNVFTNTRFFFDWYEVTYDRALRARDDRLLLTTENGSAGNVLARVRGFSGADLLLFDVTDPATPGWVDVAPGQIVPVGGGAYDLRFDHDNASGTAAFVAIRESSVPAVPVSEMAGTSPGSLLAGGAGVRWVAVTHEDFLEGAARLADFRARRMTARAVAISEVYDVFGNGARHPDAIKSYAAYAYHRWVEPLAFLLLIGDASEDHKGVMVASDPDLVPSHSLFADYEGSPEESDQYYAEVTRAAPGGPFDDLADLYVGRLALNTAEELDWNIERMVAYETEDPDGLWRRKALFLADDSFSGSLGAVVGNEYSFRRSENGFCTYSRLYADSLLAHPFDALLPEVLCMREWSHPCPDSCYDSPQDDCENGLGKDCGFWYECRNSDWVSEYTCMRESMKAAVVPLLRDKLNEGLLIWNFQGHANKFFLTHEEVWRDDPFLHRRDVETLANFGRPFLFLGFACHLAEFDNFDERSAEDCLSEKMMNLRQFAADRPGGCIASFSSSGFEFLIPNLSFNQHVMDAFYYPDKMAAVTSVGGDPAPGGVYRWTLGESTTRARLLFQTEHPGSGRTRQAAQRFVLLGDPALEPNLGSPELAASVDGVPVEDPSSPFFVDAGDHPAPLEVVVTATDGRGISSMRVVDSIRGEVPPSDYQIVVGEETADGVALSRTLRYEFGLRNEDYDLMFRAVDGAGLVSEFPLRVSGLFEFDNGEPAVYPNPFSEETHFFYELTNDADAVSVQIYTINGRKIREIRQGARGANRMQRVAWNGRDENGNVVANGTYLLRFRAVAEEGELERILPVVKMR